MKCDCIFENVCKNTSNTSLSLELALSKFNYLIMIGEYDFKKPYSIKNIQFGYKTNLWVIYGTKDGHTASLSSS